MKDWEYSFKPTSRAEWFQQIEKDLNSKPVESLQSEWWPGEPVLPFHHRDDNVPFIALPDHYFIQPPKIMEWLPVSSNPAGVNRKIISALEFGAQSIVLELINTSSVDFESILKGVHKDMIEIAYQAADPVIQPAEKHGHFRQRMVRSSKPASEFFKGIQTHSNAYVVYKIPMTGSWIEQVVTIWQTLRDDFRSWQSGDISIKNFSHKCILQISPDTNFIKQIIQTRVLQLLWLNEVNQYAVSLSKFSPIEVHIQPQRLSDPDQYLLRASEMALASVLSGAGAICIHHIEDPEVPEHYRRNNRNIHHLLHVESQMSKGRDPMAGTHAIDFYTNRWCHEILARLD